MSQLQNTNIRFNDEGQELTVKIQLRYEDLEVFELPESCSKCPVGFQKHNCGRKVPFDNESYIRRPATCKLKLIRTNIELDQNI